MSSNSPRDPKRDETFCNVRSIHGFSALLGPPATETAESSIRFGSTILISGPPGAGKTTFALATVRAMMAHASRKSKQKTIAYYVSSEVHQEKLEDNFESFGWFVEGAAQDANADVAFKFHIDSATPDKTNFYPITPMPEVDRPVPSPEELVNGIFNRIVHTLLPSEAPNEQAKIYVIVDSITALLKGCANSGDERRQTHEIMRRLQDRFGKDYLALTMLLAEHDHRSQDTGITNAPTKPTEPSVEDYLADIVFRLYVRNLPLGRRSRILEVVKSQGVNMTLGEHTWQIISDANSGEVLRYEEFSKDIKEKCLEFDNESGAASADSVQQWGGVIVFPRPRLQYDITRVDAGSNSEPSSGEDGSDVKTDEPKADELPSSGTTQLHLALRPGAITLIAGPMGSGKTTLCKQFLSRPKPPNGHSGSNNQRFLVSFDIPTQTPNEGGFKTLHFTQSQFDLNVLVSHIDWIIENGCERLAFDGLSEWITMFQKPEAARVLEALMGTVKRPREKTPPPVVFMTYEMPLDGDPLNPAALGTAADHLVVVRQIPINDELRKVIYVLKDAGNPPGNLEGPTPQHPCELKWVGGNDGKPTRLVVDTTSLEAYTGLLSSPPKVMPAKVLIQLFDENLAEKRCNQECIEQIESRFFQRISLSPTRFSLSEIGSTLDTAFAAGKPGEAFNLAIHSIDEWWLKANKTREYLLNLKARNPMKGPNHHDFWWFEVDKGFGGIGTDKPKSWHAVPGYIDFGMFCINFDAMSEKMRLDLCKRVQAAIDPKNRAQPAVIGFAEPAGGLSETSREARDGRFKRNLWQQVLGEVPRLWAHSIEIGGVRWFEIGAESSSTVLGYALLMTGQIESSGKPRKNLRRSPVFSFDSSTRETSACMFFELAWAFGASESFLGSNGQATSGAEKADADAATNALLFLQFLVMEGLLPARSLPNSKSNKGEPILFSRHWYSTLRKEEEDKAELRREEQQKAALRNEDEEKAANGLMALPFMPVGQEGSELVDSLLKDVLVRQHYWIARAEGYNKTSGEASSSRLGSIREAQAKSWEADTPDKRLLCAIEVYQLSREWLLEMASRPPAVTDADSPSWAPDLDDLIELAAWAALRLPLFFGRGGGRFPKPDAPKNPRDPIVDAFHEVRWVRHSLPDLGHLITKPFQPGNVVATGYVCCGSWMYGVGKNSRSSDIQAQILSELTSLDSAQKRAELGAGMSARKDFLYLNGEKPVVGMEYLHWWELLRFGGSRCRRRDRVFDTVRHPGSTPTVESRISEDPGPVYNAIHCEVLGCLRIADLYRQQYARGGGETTSAVATVSEKANASVAAIYAAVAKSFHSVEIGQNNRPASHE